MLTAVLFSQFFQGFVNHCCCCGPRFHRHPPRRTCLSLCDALKKAMYHLINPSYKYKQQNLKSHTARPRHLTLLSRQQTKIIAHQLNIHSETHARPAQSALTFPRGAKPSLSPMSPPTRNTINLPSQSGDQSPMHRTMSSSL